MRGGLRLVCSHVVPASASEDTCQVRKDSLSSSSQMTRGLGHPRRGRLRALFSSGRAGRGLRRPVFSTAQVAAVRAATSCRSTRGVMQPAPSSFRTRGLGCAL